MVGVHLHRFELLHPYEYCVDDAWKVHDCSSALTLSCREVRGVETNRSKCFVIRFDSDLKPRLEEGGSDGLGICDASFFEISAALLAFGQVERLL
jgi:hypothetical protein